MPSTRMIIGVILGPMFLMLCSRGLMPLLLTADRFFMKRDSRVSYRRI